MGAEIRAHAQLPSLQLRPLQPSPWWPVPRSSACRLQRTRMQKTPRTRKATRELLDVHAIRLEPTTDGPSSTHTPP